MFKTVCYAKLQMNPKIKLAMMFTATIMAIGTLGMTATTTTMTASYADEPENPECWGVVTSQRATTEGDIGEHSSDQDEPRQGIGRLADHPSELGTFLASIDEIDETECP